MENRGLIPTYAHGILDYLGAILLLIAPNIFGFADLNSAVEYIPRLIGFLVLFQAIVTDYELGVFRVLPFKVHKTVDIIVGLYLAVSPFIHGFSELPLAYWLPHVAVGVAVLFATLISKTYPEYRLESAT